MAGPSDSPWPPLALRPSVVSWRQRTIVSKAFLGESQQEELSSPSEDGRLLVAPPSTIPGIRIVLIVVPLPQR
jgi:hypothetical protein